MITLSEYEQDTIKLIKDAISIQEIIDIITILMRGKYLNDGILIILEYAKIRIMAMKTIC